MRWASGGNSSTAAIRQIQNRAGDFTLTGSSLPVSTVGGIHADRGTSTVNSAVSTSMGINVGSQTATSLLILGGSNTIHETITITSAGAVRLTHASALGGTGSLVTVGVTGGTASLDINGLTISGLAFCGNNGFYTSLLSSSTIPRRSAMCSSDLPTRSAGISRLGNDESLVIARGIAALMREIFRSDHGKEREFL